MVFANQKLKAQRPGPRRLKAAVSDLLPTLTGWAGATGVWRWVGPPGGNLGFFPPPQSTAVQDESLLPGEILQRHSRE